MCARTMLLKFDIYQTFSCLTTTLVQWQGDSVTVTVLIFITALLYIWPKGYWEPCNKIRPQCPTKHGLQFELGTFWLKCNALTHYKYLHLPIDKAPINFKFKFFENFTKNICSFTYMCMYINLYIYIYKYMYIYMYVCVCVCVYIYIYTHTHTHTSNYWWSSYKF